MSRITFPLAILALLTSITACALSTAGREYQAAISSKPNLEHGEELFRTCAICHQAWGGGMQDGSVPRIAGQHFQVLVKQLVDYRYDARWDIRMEHFTNRHVVKDAQAVADIAAWASQLEPQTVPGVGEGDLVGHGASVYAARCRSCHGDAGEGDARELVPRIAGQHYEYLLRQMVDAADGRRPNFSSNHVRLLATLERDDLIGLADFLSRSQWTDTTQSSTGSPPVP